MSTSDVSTVVGASDSSLPIAPLGLPLTQVKNSISSLSPGASQSMRFRSSNYFMGMGFQLEWLGVAEQTP